MKGKKKGWREVGKDLAVRLWWILVIPDADVTPGFYWNYLFFYRLKTNVFDSLAIGANSDGSDNSVGARQLVEVCNQSANVRFIAAIDTRDLLYPLTRRRQPSRKT